MSRKKANSLMALSSAAVLTVYAAGYTKTKSAADRLEGTFRASRPSIPRPAEVRQVKFEQPIATAPAAPAIPAIPPAAETPASPSAAAPEKPKAIAHADVAPAISKTIVAKTTVAKTIEAKKVDPVPAAAPAPDAPAVPATPAPAAAPAPAPAPDPYKAVIAAAAAPWKDGSFAGWGSCRHGDLEVTVTIKDGKIVSAPVTNCQTRYSCDIISKLPPQVLRKQSPDVDYVGGATQSTDAYYWALVVALGKAH